MKRIRPIHAFVAVLLFSAVVLVADYAIEGGFQRGSYERVAPGRDGLVRIALAGFQPEEVRFYRFLNAGNQEVKFFVGKDEGGTYQVAFDANELCYKLKRGYRADGAWVTCNKCDRSFRLAEVNDGNGGCQPVPLTHRIVGEELVVAENDVLKGWRLFR